MRTLFATLVITGLVVATGLGQDEKGPPKEKEKAGPSLKVGDPAPPLEATKWLQGEEVKKFEAGKVYVVEFWATWCGPCIVMMPHMAEMQAQFRDKGVTLIGFSPKDASNTEEKVTAFVKKRGPKLGYTFAFADDRKTNDAYMKAAGRNGIPCSFVVDKASKIAYIGHPMFLDVVVPKVVDGTWKGPEEVAPIEQEVNNVFKSLRGDAQKGLKALDDFEAKYPALKDIPYFNAPRLSKLLEAEKTDEARAFAERTIKKATKWEDPLALRAMSMTLRTGAKDNKDLMALAVKAAEGLVVAMGDKDAQALINLASTHFAAGDKARAREFGKKAVEAAADAPARVRQLIEKQAKAFEE